MGLYKMGQGYWVRMMTAIAISALFLAAAGWAWSKLSAVSIPMPTWRLQAAEMIGTPAPGDTLQLQKAAGGGLSVELGTAKVLSFTPQGEGQGELLVGSIEMVKNQFTSETNRIRMSAADPAAAPRLLAMVSRADGIPAFQRVYLQAGIAGIVLVIGGVLIYWYVGANRKSVDFLIATDGEMKKVNWSTRKNIQNSTYVVIAVTFLIAGVIFIFDIMLQSASQFIGLLGGR